jgi:hypothetical protein
LAASVAAFAATLKRTVESKIDLIVMLQVVRLEEVEKRNGEDR